MQLSSKKFEILDAAQEIIQRRGYNGFSYADISKSVSIRKASIHHHFPSKSSLGVAVIRRYREIFNNRLVEFESTGNKWIDKIHSYAMLYEDVLLKNKLCLCGMLAADIETLPRVLQKEIRGFFADNEAWLAKILSTRYKSMPTSRLNEIAWQIISTLQGAVIMARMQNKNEIFSSTLLQLLSQLEKLK
jgi:TetR/AcrR family transcriptional repressor of nem operon